MGEMIGVLDNISFEGHKKVNRRIRRGIAMPWCQSDTQWPMEIEFEQGPFLEATVAGGFKHTQTLDSATSVDQYISYNI